MKKLLNNPWISGTLALLAVAFIANSLTENSGSTSSYSVEDTVLEEEVDYTEDSLETIPALSVFDANSIQKLASQDSTRNLFQRKADKAENLELEPEKQEMIEETIRVKGIWIQNNIRYVIIDDRTLQPGQSTERIRVLSIDEQGVWVTSNEESHYIEPGQSWTYRYPKPQDNSQN